MAESVTVYIYCRSEDTSCLDEREAACCSYCLRNGLTISAVYRERASSLYRQRLELGGLRQRYREGTVQGVVIAALDRLSRSQLHLVILIGEMAQHDTTR
jgi:DNA invertase Pin-like site-specific DNA recombinase